MNHKRQLTYHQAALDLIDVQPLIAEEAIALLNQLERKRNFTLPASIREWYSLKCAVAILSEYSNTDRAV